MKMAKEWMYYLQFFWDHQFKNKIMKFNWGHKILIVYLILVLSMKEKRLVAILDLKMLERNL